MNTRAVLLFCILLLLLKQEFVSAQYWMQAGGSPSIDEALAITSDGSNNIYSTGYFTSTLSLGGMQLVSAGLEDIFISKMGPSGNLIWLKRAGSSGQERALSIDADANGNVVIAGYYYGTTDFGGITLTSIGQQDIFIAKYNTAGTLIWAKSAGGLEGDICNAVKFDQSGNVIIAGEFSDTCSFDGTNIISEASSIDAFIAKYDSNGNLVWVKKGSGKYTDRATSLTIDPSNNIYVSGLFSDTISFTGTYPNNMQNAAFLLKLNPSGIDGWFRWVGSAVNVISGGIDYSNSGINMTGSFSGSLFFFGGVGNPVLNPASANNIFVARYNTSGVLDFKTSNGSDDIVTATAIGSTQNGQIIIGGNFACRFTDYSGYYDTGLFRSIGHLDTYVAAYDPTGTWLWARQYGGRKDDYINSLTVYKDSIPVTAGSFLGDFIAPINSGVSFTPHGNVPVDNIVWNTNTATNYCGDNAYNTYIEHFTKGNSDIVINAAVNTNRQPFDFYQRVTPPNTCNRNELIPCIRHNGICTDSLFTCASVVLSFDPGGGTGNVFNELVKPSFSQLWSNGATTGILLTATPGYQKATITSEDGCYSYSDSLFLTTSFQAAPQISDSKGINISNPLPVDIELCIGDSVQIWCANQGASTLTWTGYSPGVNPIIVDSAGTYECTLTNALGCSSVSNVTVTYADTLANNPIDPSLLCLEDFDHNDTISLCQYESFHVYLFDDISNPNGALGGCIADLSTANWTLDSAAFLAFDFYEITPCGLIINTFNATQAGDYNIIFNIEVIRANACGTDTVNFTDTLFVNVRPVNNSTFNVDILGNDTICPGDTIILTASPPGFNYQWNNGVQGLSIYVLQPGGYSVSGTSVTTNIYGCNEYHTGTDSVYVAQFPDPVLTTSPVSGIICPNDSVQISSSSLGPIQWFGPTGMITGSNQFIYSSTPGNYYCVQETGPGCTLLSNTISLSQSTTPTMIASPDSACPGSPIVLNIYSSPGSSIQWLAPLSGTAQTQTVFAGGVYQCDVNSCGILVTVSASANYFAAPVVPIITVNSPDLTSTVAVAYQWYLNGNTISGATGQNITPSISGSYTVVTTDINGCTAESLPFIFTGLVDLSDNNFISVSPNPVTDYFNFIFYDQQYFNKLGRINFRDIRGKLLRSSEYHYGESVYVGDFTNGFYFVELMIDDMNVWKKIVVQK